VLPQFTGEEVWGSCLDLHEHFVKFINIKGINKIDYLTYLDLFYKFTDDQTFKNADYKDYIKALVLYLTDFVVRAQPLQEWQSEFKSIENEFQQKWQSGEFTGWKIIFPELPTRMEIVTKERDRKNRARNREKREREIKENR
jgi:splicing factor 3A subunit 3